MELDPKFIAPSPPHIRWPSISEEEKVHAKAIELNLSQIWLHSTGFAAALTIFQVSQQNNESSVIRDWAHVAARDGAMTIRNYLTALAAMRSLMGRIPSILTIVDTSSLKSSQKAFEQRFPFAHKMRHSVAHPEFYADANKDMSFSGTHQSGAMSAVNVQNLVVQNMIENEMFKSTFEGVFVHYDVSAQNLLFIIETTKSIFSVFEPLDPFKNIVR